MIWLKCTYQQLLVILALKFVMTFFKGWVNIVKYLKTIKLLKNMRFRTSNYFFSLVIVIVHTFVLQEPIISDEFILMDFTIGTVVWEPKKFEVDLRLKIRFFCVKILHCDWSTLNILNANTREYIYIYSDRNGFKEVEG